MRRLATVVLLLTLFLAAGCRKKVAAELQGFESVYTPEFASGFEVLSNDACESTILVTRTPWQGATEPSYLFISRNGELPPEGFEGQVLKGDAERIVCMSTSYVAMLDALGVADRVVGVSGTRFLATELSQPVADVGYDNNVDYELLVSLQPDIVLIYGVAGGSVVEQRLAEAGIPYAYIGEYLEDNPLGKAEWIVAIGEITGKRAEALDIFRPIPKAYNNIRRLAKSAENKPKVMLNTPYGDSWMMASSTSYVGRLISDAGGDYIYGRDTGNSSRPIDLEEAYMMASEADYWINPGALRSMADFKALLPRFADVKAVKDGNVYNCTRRTTPGGGNDYWESAVMRPDFVLADLVKIFHPELADAIAADYPDMTYYEKLQ